ncbi:MAG: hypothetical protein V7K65_03940 [Nostoc sp.]
MAVVFPLPIVPIKTILYLSISAIFSAEPKNCVGAARFWHRYWELI